MSLTETISKDGEVSVTVSCSSDHCDDYLSSGCPHEPPLDTAHLSASMQRAFRQCGPEAERLCDWFRCMEEPWRTLAEVLGCA